MGFAERFSELVPKRGDVARLAEATGMNDSILSKYKRGITEPTLPQAEMIAKHFDVSLDWLAGREGYPRDAHKRPRPSSPLSPDEAKLVDNYRRADESDRPALESMAAMAALAGEAKNEGQVRADAVVGDSMNGGE